MPVSLFFFPLSVIVASLLSLLVPEFFSSLKFLIIPLLALIMFGMGMTLSVDDFKSSIEQYGLLSLGLVLQFTLMPFLAYALTVSFQLSLDVMVGFVLLGSCPGGTASNVMCYLAKGNVALSILITICSTLLAIFLTPLLTWFYVGHRIDVPVISMIWNIFFIVIGPVALGILINKILQQQLNSIRNIFPLISMAAIVFIIAIIVALNTASLAKLTAIISMVVILHNLIGFALAYYICLYLRCSESNRRTLAIEVAMQNSGLAVALAVKYFNPLASLPGALFSVWHNVSAGVIASYWRNRADK